MPKIGGVALLAEGVDRNNTSQGMLSRPVALLAEGVDRNFDDVDCDCD